MPISLRGLFILSLPTIAISASCQSMAANKASTINNDHHRYIIHYHPQNAPHILAPTASPLVSAEMQIDNLRGQTHHVLPQQHAVSATLSDAAVKQLQHDPSVAFVELDPVRELTHAGLYTYGVEMIQAPLVLDNASSNQKVCIIDTGYDATHEDLPNGANITGEVVNTLTDNQSIAAWNEDSYGHGTHITGTIAALGNNLGYEGILPSGQLNIHHVKIIDNPNYYALYGSDVAAAINACSAANATVINMSIAGTSASQAEQSAVEAAYNDGALLVAAAGNRGNSQAFYPASYDQVISVGAVDNDKAAWAFTQHNEHIELVAPGVGIKSTLPNNRYGSWDGTSMAAPHVSGVAALVWSQFPQCSNQRIRQAITESAQDLGDVGKDTTFGYGLVQTNAAVDWLNNNTCHTSFKNCQAIVDAGQSHGSDVYAIDVDGEGALEPIEVLCEMDKLGGGWTLFAYHADNLPERTPRTYLDGKNYGVIPDTHWNILKHQVHNGIMLIDEHQRLSYMSAEKTNNVNCKTLQQENSLVHGSRKFILHHEDNGCSVSGLDYTQVLMRIASDRRGNIDAASLYQMSTLKFDIWPYPSNRSRDYQDKLHYYIK